MCRLSAWHVTVRTRFSPYEKQNFRLTQFRRSYTNLSDNLGRSAWTIIWVVLGSCKARIRISLSKKTCGFKDSTNRQTGLFVVERCATSGRQHQTNTWWRKRQQPSRHDCSEDKLPGGKFASTGEIIGLVKHQSQSCTIKAGEELNGLDQAWEKWTRLSWNRRTCASCHRGGIEQT